MFLALSGTLLRRYETTRLFIPYFVRADLYHRMLYLYKGKRLEIWGLKAKLGAVQPVGGVVTLQQSLNTARPNLAAARQFLCLVN